MSENGYDLTRSSRKLGPLYPILKDAKGNIIDGFHRQNADPDWPSITLSNVDNPVKLELARLASNYCRRAIAVSEVENRIKFLVKNGLKPEEIAEAVGMHPTTVYRHLPAELKDAIRGEAISKGMKESELARASSLLEEAEEKALSTLVECNACRMGTRADQITVVDGKPYCPKHAPDAHIAFEREKRRLEEAEEKLKPVSKPKKPTIEPPAGGADEAERCVTFVKHLEEHIKNGDKGVPKNGKVVCKFCNRTIDEIYAEVLRKWGE